MKRFDEEGMMHARTRCLQQLAAMAGTNELMVIIPAWIDGGRVAYRCELGKAGDGIVTRWCDNPDLAVDAALAAAKAMGAVFGGEG